MGKRRGNAVLRRVRASLGLTQRAFGEKCRVHSVYICQIETGACDIGGEIALRIVYRYRSTFLELGLTLENLLRGRLS